MAVIGGVPFQDLEMRKAPPLWRRPVQPVLNIPSAIGKHAEQAWESMGIAEPSLLDEHPSAPPGYRAARTVGKNLLGGFNLLMAPVAAAYETLWGDPVSSEVQTKGDLLPFIDKPPSKEAGDLTGLYGSVFLPGGITGALAKVSKLDKVLDPKLWQGFKSAAQRGRTGASSQIAGGDDVFVRLNLNVKPKKSGTTSTDYMLTFHRRGKDGRPDYSTSIAYDQGAALKNVFFDIDQPSRIAIAGKEASKSPIASVGGKFRSVSYKTMQSEMKNAEVVASFNPAKGNFFIDVKTGAPIKSADKAVLIGDKVYLRGNVKYHDRSKLTAAEEGGILRQDLPINWERRASGIIARSKASPYKSDIFDFGRYGDVPGQPQTPIPRIALTDYQQEKWDKLITPANLKQTIKHVDDGLAHGGFEWYDLEPLRYRFVEELGPKIGNQQFTEFVQMVGATSVGSKVPINIRRAAYFYHILQNSKNPMAAITKWKQGLPTGLGHYRHKKHTPGLEQTYAHPYNYGLLTTEAGLHQAKTSGFSHNLMGNWEPTAMDLHMMRMMTGGKVTGSAPKAAYAHPEGHVVDIAKQFGVTPAQAQAAAWTGFTGYKDKPFLVLFEEIIKKTATKHGKTPDQILKDWMNGKIPLASVLPMGATQLGTELADDIFGEKLIG